MTTSLPNTYRAALVKYQTTVDTYMTDLCGEDGTSYPGSAAVSSVSAGAWQSTAADEWCTDITTLGGYIKDCIQGHADDVAAAIQAEPEEIDPDDTANAWKTTWVEPPSYATDPAAMPTGAAYGE